MQSVLSKALVRWPHLQFKRKSPSEYSSGCPFCGMGDDRFLLFEKGNYWCRQCDAKGFIDDDNDEWARLTKAEKAIRALEAKQREMEQRQEEHERRLSALERMARCTDHLRYHEALTWEAIDYWHEEGMTNATIDRYKLGYCDRCPTDRDGRSSYTIPVIGRDGATLTNIRHRLVNADNGDKYRPHMAGLGAQLFNSHYTTTASGNIIITEGEKKSIVLSQEGFANVGIMGQRSFMRQWIDWLSPFRTVYVALDPDAKDSAHRLAHLFNGKGRVVSLPVKPDDFFTRYGGTRDDFKYYVNIASASSSVA